jgi:hypothetical protein
MLRGQAESRLGRGFCDTLSGLEVEADPALDDGDRCLRLSPP